MKNLVVLGYHCFQGKQFCPAQTSQTQTNGQSIHVIHFTKFVKIQVGKQTHMLDKQN